MMDGSEKLIKEAQRRMEPYDVEGFVWGQGNENGGIMIVGEAPGENEAVKGEPFIGRAGDELDKQLAYLGLKREEVYITSVVRSRPYKWVKTNKKGAGGKRKANRKPNQKEIKAHASLLDYQIDKMQPEIIIPLGGVAFERLTRKKSKLSEVVGQVIKTPVRREGDNREGEFRWTEETYTLLPLYHPAAVFYNPKVREDIYESLAHVKAYIDQKEERNES